MFINGSKLGEQYIQRTFHRCFLPSFNSLGQAVSEEKMFQKSTNQKQEYSVAAMFANGSELNGQSLQRTFQGCFLPKFDSLGQAISEKIFFLNQAIRNKNGLWRPCLLTDRDDMSYLYRGPPIDVSFQVSVHLSKRFQKRRFLKSANQKQKLPVAAMFVHGSGRNEQSLQKTFHRCFLPSFSSFG